MGGGGSSFRKLPSLRKGMQGKRRRWGTRFEEEKKSPPEGRNRKPIEDNPRTKAHRIVMGRLSKGKEDQKPHLQERSTNSVKIENELQASNQQIVAPMQKKKETRNRSLERTANAHNGVSKGFPVYS